MASRIEDIIDGIVTLAQAIAPTATVEKNLFPIFDRSEFDTLTVIISPSDQTAEIESRGQSLCECEVDLVICKNTVDRSEIGSLIELRQSFQDGLLRSKVEDLTLYRIDTQGANSIINQAMQTSKNTFVSTLKLKLKGIINV